MGHDICGTTSERAGRGRAVTKLKAALDACGFRNEDGDLLYVHACPQESTRCPVCNVLLIATEHGPELALVNVEVEMDIDSETSFTFTVVPHCCGAG